MTNCHLLHLAWHKTRSIVHSVRIELINNKFLAKLANHDTRGVHKMAKYCCFRLKKRHLKYNLKKKYIYSFPFFLAISFIGLARRHMNALSRGLRDIYYRISDGHASTLSEGLRIGWLYPPQRGKTTLRLKKGVSRVEH